MIFKIIAPIAEEKKNTAVKAAGKGRIKLWNLFWRPGA